MMNFVMLTVALTVALVVASVVNVFIAFKLMTSEKFWDKMWEQSRKMVVKAIEFDYDSLLNQEEKDEEESE